MNKAEFKQAWKIAQNNNIDLTQENIDHFNGFGLKNFEPIYATLNQVARVIRWQCAYIFGGWNYEELSEIAKLGRKRFLIID